MNTAVGASKLTHPAVTATSADLLESRGPACCLPDRNRTIAHGAARYQPVG
jgi:hypothetical protein